MQQKNARFKLPWEYLEAFTDVLGEEDEIMDEVDLVARNDDLNRLKEADEITKNMSHQEYVFYSECKTASFSHRKNKRFRDWLNMSALTDMKPNDDVADILGFLGYEMVRRITEFALLIRQDEQDRIPVVVNNKKEQEDLEIFSMFACSKKKGHKFPLEESHILEAYRRLQTPIYPHPYKRTYLTRALLA